MTPKDYSRILAYLESRRPVDYKDIPAWAYIEDVAMLLAEVKRLWEREALEESRQAAAERVTR